MIVAEVSIEPIGTGTPSYGDLVAESVKVLKGQNDVTYDITAMGTILEGDREKVIRLVNEMTEACFKAGAKRCLTNVRLDERRDRPMLPMEEMERQIEQKLGIAPGPRMGTRI
ncbi:MAG: MTH1187 family thiamine-binding protein [Chloroflexi bacterium]|nr:MTH1187 family thiamine-binding protein [Chloroflexota bacterium]